MVKGSNQKVKNVLINLTVLAVSIGLAWSFANSARGCSSIPPISFILRWFTDDVLGAVPSPSAMAGFDRWGFRNRKVPETVDIVAVGDSHTYGNTAKWLTRGRMCSDN